MTQTGKMFRVCGSTEITTIVRKSITVHHCTKCKAVWHVLPDTEPPTA
jgi:hypothetical protein